jgi:HTH domain
MHSAGDKCGQGGSIDRWAGVGVEAAMSGGLDRTAVEAIAVRVVELLETRSGGRFVTAAELSRRLGISRSTVYARAEELGAIRLGTGPRARLRFDLEQVVARLGGARTQAAPARRSVRRRQGPRRPSSGLLPIRGTAAR